MKIINWEKIVDIIDDILSYLFYSVGALIVFLIKLFKRDDRTNTD